MADPRPAAPARDREGARKNAQNHFTSSEQRNTLIRQEIARERTLVDQKTAKLKALRLAKEEEDRLAAAAAPPPAPAKAKKPRTKKTA